MKGDDHIINVLQSLDTSWLGRVSNNFNNGVIKMLNIQETDPDVLVAAPVTLDKQNREANE